MLVKLFKKPLIIVILIRVLIRRNNIYSVNRVLFAIIMKYIFNHDRIKIKI